MAIGTNAEIGKPATSTVPGNRWLLVGVGVVVILIGLLIPHLGGPSPTPAATPESTSGSEMGGMLLRLAGGTAFVLVLCVATLWICRRWLGPASPGVLGKGNFEIVESLPLGANCRVHLVRVGDRHMLAGMDPTGLKAMLQVEGIAARTPDETQLVGQASTGE